ncbi:MULTISPECIES: TadE family type IV pilus minor pilin [Streptomyces]|uniref:TadE family type IV pilus minor pilin n=1 Tax=Streptomyces TaxID=1883 RepID=UPI001F04E2A7|nr:MULTISPECIES: TadE family type IV pilus minor pilin [Streptomyces]
MCRSEGSGRARAACAGAGPPGGRGARDAGFVTAEAAVVLPVLVAVAAALIWGLLAACARIACVDAARAAARAAARQEPAAQVLAAARGAAPLGARITVAREGDLVRVRVEAALPGGARLPVRVGGEAVALAEETVR